MMSTRDDFCILWERMGQSMVFSSLAGLQRARDSQFSIVSCGEKFKFLRAKIDTFMVLIENDFPDLFSS